MASLLHTDQIEKDIFKLRWVVLVVGLLTIVFQTPPSRAAALSWTAVIVGLLYNAGVGYVLYRRSYAPYVSYATTFLDAALLSLYIASLAGPTNVYAPLYLFSVISGAMRLGPAGTLGVGVMDCLFYVAALASAETTISDWRSQILLPCGLILLVAALLSYFVHVLHKGQHEKAERVIRLEKRITELAILQEVNTAVHNLKAGDTLRNIVEVSTKVLGFERAALYLVTGEGSDSDKSFFSTRDVAHVHETGYSSPMFPPRPDDDVFAKAFEQNKPFVLYDHTVDGDSHPHNWIVIPLRGADAPIGVLIVDGGRGEPANDDDLDMLSNLASSAVLAIENSRLHSRVQRMANLDGLTDLFNHRYFQESLRATLKDAERKGGKVSLVMVEMDKFKLYNDTYGHQRGDWALKSVARALKASVQPHEGMVARYGGDEFMVILPGVDKGQAIKVAREIRQWIVRLTAAEMSQHNLPGLTASLGVATFPNDARNASDLIDATDQAMYVAKRNGGDAVCGIMMKPEASNPDPRG